MFSNQTILIFQRNLIVIYFREARKILSKKVNLEKGEYH